MKLELEFVCTEPELEEVRSLAPQLTIGGGSKWRLRLIVVAFYAAMLFGLDLQFRQNLELPTRLCVLTGFAALFVVLHFARRRRKSGPPPPSERLEASETDLTIVSDRVRVSVPWSGFARMVETPSLLVLLDRQKQAFVVVPKRTFPDSEALEWFRARATGLQDSSSSREDAASPVRAPASPGQIGVVFRLGFPDFLNRTASSWRTRTIVLGVLGVAVGVPLLMTTWKPFAGGTGIPASAVVIEVATLFGLAVTVILIGTALGWLSERKHRGLRRMVLADDEIRCDDDLEHSVVSWSVYAMYMENRWAFFIWDARRRSWHMIPKRAFASAVELDRCRSLLSRKLRLSRWFWI